MSGPVFRAAREGDEETILAILQEFAVFEKLTETFRATRETIARDMIGPKRRVECEMAEWDGKPAGLMMWFRSYSTFQARSILHVEDIWIDPAFRRRGLARAFFKRLAQRALAEDAAGVHWLVLSWNARAIEFYESIGAPVDDEWQLCRLKGQALKTFVEER